MLFRKHDPILLYMLATWLAAIIILILLDAVASSQAKDMHVDPAHWPKWPCSQCTGGWVDKMTGMCPYRPSCKIRSHRTPRR